MSELLESLVGSKDEREKFNRTKKARNDFGFFCQNYLLDYFFAPPAEYQQILYDVATSQSLSVETAEKLKSFVAEKYQPMLIPTHKLAGAMFVEPREHGKTVRWSFAYVLWRVLTGRAKYVLLIGASGDSARENLINIKTELEDNELLIEDFGLQQGKVWRDDRIELVNGTCIQCKGAGASMRGTRFRQYRPELIILDDVLKDDAVDSPTQRNKIHRWLKRVVFNLGKSAFIIWVNTIFHNDDPISRLFREVEAGTLKRWIGVRLSCLRPDNTPLWPEYWSVEDFNEKKSSIGVAAFSTEYCNEPLSDEERIVCREWIEEHRYAELPERSKLRFYMGIDPATGAHDGTAMCPVAQHIETGVLYVLPGFCETCTEQKTVEEAVLFHKMWQFASIGWESVVFSAIYGKYVQKLAAEKSVYLPISPITVGNVPKTLRVRSYSMLIQNGFIRFPVRGTSKLEQQLEEFPLGAFDDYCDALWLAIKAAEQGGKGVTAVQSLSRRIKSTAERIIGRARRF